jgi:hypothetical protein
MQLAHALYRLMKIHNCICGMRDLQKLTRYRTRIWSIPTVQLRVVEALFNAQVHANPLTEEPPLRRQSYEWLRHQRPLDELPVHRRLCEYEACFTRSYECKVHKSPLGAGSFSRYSQTHQVCFIGLVSSGTLSWVPVWQLEWWVMSVILWKQFCWHWWRMCS